MKKLIKLNISKRIYDEKIDENWENGVFDFENECFYNYLFNSKNIQKILISYNNTFYIKYPEFKHRFKNKNKKLFEIKNEKRSFTQKEINRLLTSIKEYARIPKYIKIIEKIQSKYKDMGQWKIQINLKNIYCKIYFFGMVYKNYKSCYQEYLNEVMPDNYCIINYEEL